MDPRSETPVGQLFQVQPRATWLVIASRTIARIYQPVDHGSRLELIQEISNPEGRLKEREISSDRPGRTFSSATLERHGYTPPELPSERVAAQFAKEIGRILNEGLARNGFERLALIAEPKFLGRLRNALGKGVCDRLCASLDKDLTQIPEHELPARLGKLMRLPYIETLEPYDRTA